MAKSRFFTLRAVTQHLKTPVLAYVLLVRSKATGGQIASVQPVKRVSGVLQGLPDSSAQQMKYVMGPSTCRMPVCPKEPSPRTPAN